MSDGPVLAIDQGTSSTKCLLVGADGAVLRTSSAPVPIRYPQPGWVEQDAGEILQSVLAAAAECLDGVTPAAVGFSTQRESALIWDRRTGQPLGPVLGWQDQRSQRICEDLREKGHGELVRTVSGLPLDPMFSAAKLRWLLGGAPDALVGTVDSWLMYALTGSHQIEIGNASRTQLLDVRSGAWSADLLGLFDIPERALPSLTPSSGELGRIGDSGGPLAGLPVAAVLGDSHAALYAHGRQAAGGAKVTYGTGSSVMRLLDGAETGLCLTIAWNDRLAAEGNIRSSGATIAWLAELLGTTADGIAALAADATSDGVHLVPAFGGLAAPWWDDAAVGLISGITLGTRPAHLARAALESIAHQVADVVDALDPPRHLLADGGASANDRLMQIQADLTGIPVRRARAGNLSALGAAYLAAGAQHDLEYDDFRPTPGLDATALRSSWRDAVRRALSAAPATGSRP
jgi:glycerol kinase